MIYTICAINLGSFAEWCLTAITLISVFILRSTLKKLKKNLHKDSEIALQILQYREKFKPDFELKQFCTAQMVNNQEVIRLYLISNDFGYNDLQYKFKDVKDNVEFMPLVSPAIDENPFFEFYILHRRLGQLFELWINYKDSFGKSYEIKWKIKNDLSEPVKVGPFEEGILSSSNAHELINFELSSYKLQPVQSDSYTSYDKHYGKKRRLRYLSKKQMV